MRAAEAETAHRQEEGKKRRGSVNRPHTSDTALEAGVAYVTIEFWASAFTSSARMMMMPFLREVWCGFLMVTVMAGEEEVQESETIDERGGSDGVASRTEDRGRGCRPCYRECRPG